MSEPLSDLSATLAAHPALFIGLCVALGLMIGSFLNVVVYRLPIMMDRAMRKECADLAVADAYVARGEKPPPIIEETEKKPAFNIVVPRSACPKCNAPITALQNIPVVSWLALGGKCAHCKTPISKRYPLVELFTGVASGLVAWRFGFGTLALAGLVFTWALIALTLIDIDAFLLPDQITLPLVWLGLILSTTHPVWFPGTDPVTPVASIFGAVAGYLSLWSLFWIYKLLRDREGFGYGDFKLLAAFGAWFGWKMLLPIVLFSSLSGSVIGIYVLYRQRKGFHVHLPFGPYLAIAGWLFLLVGHRVVEQYMAIAVPHR
jgi:leader peptidase (prepilin peptidase)/N-methyltransferase